MPQLELRFLSRPDLILIQTSFWPPDGDEAILAAYPCDYKWSRGPRALCALLIDARLRALTGQRASLVSRTATATIFNLLRKRDVIDATRWPDAIFGLDPCGLPRISCVFDNRGTDRFPSPRVNERVLPAASIAIALDGRDISGDVKALRVLLGAIARQSGGNPNLAAEWPGMAGQTASNGSWVADAAGRTRAPDDLALLQHWSDLLRVLTRTQRLLGSHDLHQLVRTELLMISRRRREATDELRASLLITEAQWAEFGSWIAVNLGRQQESQLWLDRSLVLAWRAEHEPLIAYGLMRQAQQAADAGDAATSTRLALEAASRPGISSCDMALCKVREAQGLVLSGDRKGCLAAINTACRLVDRSDDAAIDEDPRTIGHHCTPAYVRAYLGYCHIQLGDTSRAMDILLDTLASWPGAYRHDEGLARTWLALALCCGGPARGCRVSCRPRSDHGQGTGLAAHPAHPRQG